MKLLDYKGKYTIACDDDYELDDMDFVVGKITKEVIEKLPRFQEREVNYHQSYNEGKIDLLGEISSLLNDLISKSEEK